MVDYAALRNELLTDPLTAATAVGWNTGSGIFQPYAQLTDALAAQKLNALSTGRTRARTAVTKNEIVKAIRNADYPTTSSPDQIKWDKLNFLMFSDTLDASNQNIKDVFAAVFAGTATLTALNTLGAEAISRATELGLGGAPTENDVKLARSGVW